MIAFQKFKEIDQLEEIQQKHRAWLKDYEGINYSIAEEGKHKFQWVTEKKVYYNKFWTPSINLIKELRSRCRIEFDGDEKKAKEYLEEVVKFLKENKMGFIRSTHKGKSDYLWIEFTRDLTDKEKEAFLIWVAPEGSEIDLNFASSKKVFPILYANHWKHSFERELPIEYFEGDKINFDSLNINIDTQSKKITRKRIIKKDFNYVIGIKDTSKIFKLEGQAEIFNEVQPLFYDKSGLWWLWNEKKTCWELSDEVDILNMINQSTGKDVITSSKRTEIINSLKQVGRLNMPKKIKPTWIQFKDKIYDIETGEYFKASPKYFVTNPIPHEVSGNPKTPHIDKLFEEWVGKEYIQTLHEIISYCTLPDYPLNRLFCLIGSGMNGKSCFLNLVKRFVGINNITSTELDILLSSRFEVTRLHKKLVCLMGETNFSELSQTSILKKLTGGDLIGFEYKNKTPFEDFNYAKIIIATNNLPTTTDKTIGFYRRWMIIDFPNQFSEQINILDQIPIEEYSNLATSCLINLNNLLNKREFNKEGGIEERIKKFEDHSDPLEKFIKEFCDISDVNGHIFKWEFEKRLSQWLKENRFRDMGDMIIAKKMKDKGIESGKTYGDWYENDNLVRKQFRAWLGIKWKE